MRPFDKYFRGSSEKCRADEHYSDEKILPVVITYVFESESVPGNRLSICKGAYVRTTPPYATAPFYFATLGSPICALEIILAFVRLTSLLAHCLAFTWNVADK
jgi:hypothetical protein